MLTLLMGIFITVYLCQLGGKLPDVSFAFITQTSLMLSGSVLLSSVSLWGKAPFFCVVIFCGICPREYGEQHPGGKSPHGTELCPLLLWTLFLWQERE